MEEVNHQVKMQEYIEQARSHDWHLFWADSPTRMVGVSLRNIIF